MHLRTRALTALAALAVSFGLTNGTASATGQPAGSPGDIVTSAPTSFHPLPGQPTGTKAWHITYRSTTARGAPNVVSGTVIVPQDGRKGPRPLVTYAVGTVGLADQCAPSAGFPRGTTLEANLIQQLTLRGWAVAVTDYEGLGTPGEHTYAVGRAEGHAVLDAARAAQRLPAAGLSTKSPVGIMGYSQGGQATSWAAELHDSYAPELDVRGTATGGVPADLLKTAEYNNGGIGAGLVLMAAAGQNAAYPELGLDRYLNAKGRSYVDFMKKHCVAVDAVAGLFKRISDVTVTNPLQEADWQRALRASDLGTHAPDHPVYLYHGVIDELIPYGVGKQLRADWCAKGATVQWKSLPLGEHVLGVITESIPAANWLADRFAGKPAGGNC
ncbi:lipase family protein [Streptomyces griseocarneus]|uniref:lipase family protein n=1 Tax=Streptomyces griseocarneus TaxID=51201 RepID=UPI00167C5259|nr:lipase family protein [Streptomyces griseocarneus]MBZ6477372.1 lipase family protein [Streptomyces griseocarneus]GHG75931.1 lipase [Streptomyces griseocarneus]